MTLAVCGTLNTNTYIQQPHRRQTLARTPGSVVHTHLQMANDNGADQTARMRRLVSAFVVRMQQNQADDACLVVALQ